METFEEFEKATQRELRERAKECFEKAQPDLFTEANYANTALLQEAQFYMSELERRAGSRIALRDLLLEIVVIFLIGGEILLGIKAGRDEDKLMDKQNKILS